jgi:Zn-dependent protease
MFHRHNPLFWSFGAGTWFRVHVRISLWFPLVLLWLWWAFGLSLGAAVGGILLVSVLCHEFGHVIAARMSDGVCDEILVWPMGGLAWVDLWAAPRSQVMTAAGGPLVNLLFCGVLLPGVWFSEFAAAAFNPLTLPVSQAQFGTDLATQLQVLGFSVNWILLLLNLIPAAPLDGGQILRGWLSSRIGGTAATEASIRIAILVGIVLAVTGVGFNHVYLLSIAFLLILYAVQESHQLRSADSYDDSFLGYDFSQGYTSLERSEPRRAETRPGLIQRWKARRQAEKQRRAEQQQLDAATQLDALLAKVHQQGMDSLTDAEKRQLRRAAEQLRHRSKDPE